MQRQSNSWLAPWCLPGSPQISQQTYPMGKTALEDRGLPLCFRIDRQSGFYHKPAAAALGGQRHNPFRGVTREPVQDTRRLRHCMPHCRRHESVPVSSGAGKGYHYRAGVVYSLDEQHSNLAWKPLSRRQGFGSFPLSGNRCFITAVSVDERHSGTFGIRMPRRTAGSIVWC